MGAKIGEIMGVEAEETVRKVAFVKCAGTCEKAKKDYEYAGVEDCRAMAYVPGGGPKACSYGCMGYGSCVAACPFDAIHIVDGIAKVDKEACKACGKCVETCPRHLIELIPYEAKLAVACSSEDKGPKVMKVCEVGCIGCKLCEKQCQFDAVHVLDNVALHRSGQVYRMRRLRGEMSEEDHYHGRIKRHNNYDKKELSEFFRGLFSYGR